MEQKKKMWLETHLKEVGFGSRWASESWIGRSGSLFLGIDSWGVRGLVCSDLFFLEWKKTGVKVGLVFKKEGRKGRRERERK